MFQKSQKEVMTVERFALVPRESGNVVIAVFAGVDGIFYQTKKVSEELSLTQPGDQMAVTYTRRRTLTNSGLKFDISSLENLTLSERLGN